MIYGLYLSAQGAQAQAKQLEVTANNMANASTTAFKRDLAIFQAHQPADIEQGLIGQMPPELRQATGGLSLAEVATDFSNGTLKETGAAFDLALSGPGFFRVQGADGELLTRDGNLVRNFEGELATQEHGFPILSTTGQPLVVPPESDVEITSDGSVFPIDRTSGARAPAIGRIDVVEPADYRSVLKVGDNFYEAGGPVATTTNPTQVRQGYIEGSSTEPTTELLTMIEASRAFESNMNMAKFQDEALGRLLQMASR